MPVGGIETEALRHVAADEDKPADAVPVLSRLEVGGTPLVDRDPFLVDVPRVAAPVGEAAARPLGATAFAGRPGVGSRGDGMRWWRHEKRQEKSLPARIERGNGEPSGVARAPRPVVPYKGVW